MKTLTYSLLLMCFTFSAIAQNVGINTTTPNPQAVLDVESTDKGVLLPRLTTMQRNALGATLGTTHESMIVYDIDDTQFHYWDGTIWNILNEADTDNQDLLATLTGNMLQIDIQDGVSAIVDLTPLLNDADSDPNNEIELPMTAMPGQVLTWDGSAWVAQDAAPGADNWGTDIVNTIGTNISGDGTSASPLEMTEVDGDTTNEIQDISLSGTELTISDGSTVDFGPIVGGSGSSNTANTTPIVGSSGVKMVKLMEPTAQDGTLGMAYIGADDNIWTHGYGLQYALGIPGRTENALKPVIQPIDPVNGGKIGKWKYVFATRTSLWALTDEGEVFRRGYASNGQLGNGSTSAHLTFLTKMTFFETNNLKVKYLCIPPAISVNNTTILGASIFALTEDGDVYCWGRNNTGQLGIGNTTEQLSPVKITGLDFQFIHKLTQSGNDGGVSVAALDTLNSIYIWGYNGLGQLGLGNTTNYSAPALVQGITAKDILMTRYTRGTTLIITPSGAVMGTGSNNNGVLGDGTTTNKNVFTPTMTPFTNARSIYMDVANDCGAIVTTDGNLYTAGHNLQNGLGLGTIGGLITDYTMPAGPFQGMVDKIHIGSYGSWKSIHVIDSLGRIWACGENRGGQLGVGSTHDADPDGLFTRAMDELSGAVKFVDVRAFGHYQYNYYSTAALTEDGRVMITGAPHYGKTGQGDETYFRHYYKLVNFN